MNDQPATLSTYRVTHPDGTVEDIRAEALSIRDASAVFLVNGQPVEVLAHST